MSTQYYDDLWQDAMGELGEQLHIEGADEDDDPTAPKSVIFYHYRIYSPL